MKVDIGPYPSRLVCSFHTRYMNKKYGEDHYHIKPTIIDNFIEKLEELTQYFYNAINFVYFDNKEQKIKVRIDDHDVWSMDHTLAHIIVPMLKRLKDAKHGAPFVDLVDRPDHLVPRSDKPVELKDGEPDPFHFEAWDWVIDEMIWTFEQKIDTEAEMQFYKFHEIKVEIIDVDEEGLKAYNNRKINGYRLFGRYYEALWD